MARVAKSWGTKIAQLRKGSGLSAAGVAKRLAGLGIPLDRASIYAYESGRVAAPDAVVLWGLAQIYGVDLEELVAALLDARKQVEPRFNRMHRLVEPTSTEIAVLERFRKLTAAARKSCIDFLDYQLTMTERRRTRKSPRGKSE
jgi:transcriptional regulator with XRE-family HTH domain